MSDNLISSAKRVGMTAISKRKALSGVIVTLIILVASVMLASGVTLIGLSFFQSNEQSKAIFTQGMTIWANGTDPNNVAWGAAGIRNTGGKIVGIDTISIRGTSVPFSDWYVDTNSTRVTTTAFLSSFNLTKTSFVGYPKGSIATGGVVTPGTTCPTVVNAVPTQFMIDEDGAGPGLPLCLQQAQGPISLNPGQAMIVYYKIPNGLVTPSDGGSSFTVEVFASNAGSPVTATVGVSLN